MNTEQEIEKLKAEIREIKANMVKLSNLIKETIGLASLPLAT